MDIDFTNKSDDKLIENISKMIGLINNYYGTPHDYLIPQFEMWIQMTRDELENRNKSKRKQVPEEKVTVIDLCVIEG